VIVVSSSLLRASHPGRCQAETPPIALSEFAEPALFDKDQRVAPAAIVENKRLREVLAFIKSQQDQRAPPRLMTKSERMGYQKTGRQPRGGRRIIEKVIEQRRAAAASTARPAK
jgi:hypothetical protein